MKKLIILLLFPILTFAQWTKQQSKAGEPSYGLNIPAFTKQLNAKKATVPDASGNLSQYALIEDFNFADDKIAKKYGLRSFHGFDKDGRSISIAVSKEGVEATITDSLQTFVQPTGNGYKIGRVESKRQFSCDVEERRVISDLTDRANNRFTDWDPNNFKENMSKVAAVRGDITVVRMAIAINFEGMKQIGLTQAKGLAYLNTLMTVVNKQLRANNGVIGQLVVGNEKLLCMNSDDPFTTQDKWIGQSQVFIDKVIGSGNYDLGHVLTIGVGGNAGGIGTVTNPTLKGSAYSATPNMNDPYFFTDVVVHEIGHQLGATHTFSYKGVGVANMESGSGCTAMSYAGIAGANYNLQAHSYPFFHGRSIDQIAQTLASKTSLGSINTGNRNPIITSSIDRVVEFDTPFSLSAIATDPDGDELYYQWDEIDPTVIANTIPKSTNFSGSMFASVLPSKLNYRNFYLRDKWNVYPTISRVCNFMLTVTDGKGGRAQQKVKVTFVPPVPKVSNAPVLSIVPGSLTKTSVKLQWSIPVNFPVTEYSLYRNPTCDNSEKAGSSCENYLTKTANTFITITFNAADKLKGSVIYVVKGKNSDGWRTEKSNSLLVEIPK